MPAAPNSSTPQGVNLTVAGIGRGARLSLPFCASSIVYGLAFGLLANGTGLSAVEAVAMSALVFSGSAQVAVLQSWSSQPSLMVVFVTVIVANVRYILMGAALRSWLAPLGGFKASLALLTLVDGTFALSYSSRARGDQDAGVLIGSGLLSLGGWVTGTALGTAASQLIANPRAIGLDFIIIAFCAASAALMVRGHRDIWPALAAAAAVGVCETVTPGPWTVVVAGIAAAAVGAMRFRDPGRTPPGNDEAVTQR